MAKTKESKTKVAQQPSGEQGVVVAADGMVRRELHAIAWDVQVRLRAQAERARRRAEQEQVRQAERMTRDRMRTERIMNAAAMHA